MSPLACLRKELTPSLFSPSLNGFGKKQEQGRGQSPVCKRDACQVNGNGEQAVRPGTFQNRQPSDGRLNLLICLSKLNVSKQSKTKLPKLPVASNPFPTRGLHYNERERQLYWSQVKNRFERIRELNNPNTRNLSEYLYSLCCFLSSVLWFAEDFTMNGCWISPTTLSTPSEVLSASIAMAHIVNFCEGGVCFKWLMLRVVAITFLGLLWNRDGECWGWWRASSDLEKNASFHRT